MLEATSDLPDHKSYLHQLYVDDNNAIMEGLPPGTRMIGGKYSVMEELVAEDEHFHFQPQPRPSSSASSPPAARILDDRVVSVGDVDDDMNCDRLSTLKY